METSDQNHTAILANRLSELDTIRECIAMLIKAWNIHPAFEFHLNMVIEEAFTNVIKYAFNDDREHEIELNFNRQDDCLIITLTDDGQPYDPTAKADPDTALPASDRPIGGLGIFLVKKYMDEVRYRRHNNKNQLIFVKKLSI
jgi:anti-sigma regulatory factor (Ser/Thr protein kinase)